MRKIFSVLSGIAFFTSILAQNYSRPFDPNERPREHPVDIERMKVEVEFDRLDTENPRVLGKVTHTFTALRLTVDSIYFDGPGITVKKCTINNNEAKTRTTPEGVWVYTPSLKWGTRHSIIFDYESTPKRGIYFIGWKSLANRDTTNPFAIRNQIWTQGQGIDNRHWIPMYDDPNDKYITETVVKFDRKYQVLSNGKLVSKTDNKNGTLTWHYAMSKPHAGYLLMLGIGEYSVKTIKSSSGVSINQWYYTGMESRVEPTYRYMKEMFDFMEKELGVPYPWESYSQIMVQDFLYGAMENTTATIFGDFFFVDERGYHDRNYVGVNCHELTHQWFGDYITARSAADIWLQESYATYYPKLFFGFLNSEDDYRWRERGEANSALSAAKNDNLPVRHSGSGTARVYAKGSHVIAMLRYVLGDESFKKVITNYLKNKAYANVETNDLYQTIQDVLGLSPDWFFKQWIYGGGEPHYHVKYESLNNPKGGLTRISVQQIHARNEVIGLFKMPIVMEVHYKNGTYDSKMVWIEDEFTVTDIPNEEGYEIDYVLFDPNSKVLKKLTFKKSDEELMAQAGKAPNMMDRYDALIELRSKPLNEKRAWLTERFSAEKHHGIKAEILSQLKGDSGSESLFVEALDDEAKEVREAAIKNGAGGDIFRQALLKAVNDPSYANAETALRRISTDYPGTITKEALVKSEKVLSMGNAFRIAWLEIIYGMDRNSAHISELENFASSTYEFRTRISAMEALKRLNHLSPQGCLHLFNAALSNNGRLSAPAVSVLEYFNEQQAFRSLIRTEAAGLNADTGNRLKQRCSFLK